MGNVTVRLCATPDYLSQSQSAYLYEEGIVRKRCNHQKRNGCSESCEGFEKNGV